MVLKNIQIVWFFMLMAHVQKKYPRIPTKIPGQFPFNDLDFDLYIGLRLDKDTDHAGLPVDFYIDWVRFYEPNSVNLTTDEN